MQRPATSHSQNINQEIRKQLIPRTEKLKEMISSDQVPQSDDQMIVIQCLQKTFGFKTNQYVRNKHYLQGFISRMDFNRFVRKCNKIIEEQVIKKTKKQNESFFGTISKLLKVSIVTVITNFFLMGTIVFFQLQESITNIILILAGILMVFSSMIAAICPIILYNSKYQTINYEQMIKTRLQAITHFENDQLQKNGRKYLRWNIQKNFFWIELHIDHSLFEGNQNLEQNIQQSNNLEGPEVSANNFLKHQLPKLSEVKKQELIEDL